MKALEWMWWVIVTLLLSMPVALIDVVVRGIAVLLLYLSKILNAAVYSAWAIGSIDAGQRLMKAYNAANDQVHYIMQPKSSRKKKETEA